MSEPEKHQKDTGPDKKKNEPDPAKPQGKSDRGEKPRGSDPDKKWTFTIGELLKALEHRNRQLEMNLLYQAAFVALGVLHLFGSPFVKAINEYLKVPVAVLGIAIPALLLFLFIRFGYLLGSFLWIRSSLDKAIAHYYVDEEGLTVGDLSLAWGAVSVFELMHQYPRKDYRPYSLIPFILYLIVLLAVVGAGHAVTVVSLSHLLRAAGVGWAAATGISAVVVLAVLLVCYFQFSATSESSRMKELTWCSFGIGVVLTAGLIVADCLRSVGEKPSESKEKPRVTLPVSPNRREDPTGQGGVYHSDLRLQGADWGGNSLC